MLNTAKGIHSIHVIIVTAKPPVSALQNETAANNIMKIKNIDVFQEILYIIYSLYNGIIAFQPFSPAFSNIFHWGIIKINQAKTDDITIVCQPTPTISFKKYHSNSILIIKNRSIEFILTYFYKNVKSYNKLTIKCKQIVIQ